MRFILERIMGRYPAVFNPIWASIYPFVRRHDGYVHSDYVSGKDAFLDIYLKNGWRSDESRSGWGSEVNHTGPARRALAEILSSLKVKVFLDAPCGDFNWMRHVQLPDGATYIGGDIVEPLIDELKQKFESETYSFRVIDIAADVLPPADLWLCRDVLFHLPTLDVLSVLRNFASSSIPYLLTTTYDFPKKNDDVKPGGFRYINLRLPPFGLAEPIKKVDDFVAPAPPRYLGLWSRDQVAKALDSTS